MRDLFLLCGDALKFGLTLALLIKSVPPLVGFNPLFFLPFGSNQSVVLNWAVSSTGFLCPACVFSFLRAFPRPLKIRNKLPRLWFASFIVLLFTSLRFYQFVGSAFDP